jgi:2-amino-4-hydroxy-6-hydroxymethyldihydropteridine diphosphokinase
VKAYLGLGSNVGDRLGNLAKAVGLLGERMSVLRSSRVYETAPVGGPKQDDYLNAVIEVGVLMDARELLDVCLEVESQMGRIRAERWGPRVIDIDLLTFGRQVIDEPGLTVPHPRMHERLFVLAPLMELDADPPLPGGRVLSTMRVNFDVSDATPVAAPLS